MQHYTIRSNGRLGRLLLDAELSADSSAKSDTENVSQIALYYRQQIGLGYSAGSLESQEAQISTCHCCSMMYSIIRSSA